MDLTTEQNETHYRPPELSPARPSHSELGQFLQRHVTTGRLTLIDTHGVRTECGAGGASEPITVRLHNDDLFKRLINGGSLALGESYSDGWWDVEGDKLAEFFSLLFANNIDRLFSLGPLQHFYGRLRTWRPLRSKAAMAREDVRSHYDLSNEFFEQMLDPTMTYSCGYARSETDDLATMQQQKLRRIARKLGLHRGGTLLDIGCGWGGLLVYVGEHFPNVRGVGITLSEEQYNYARDKLHERGLSDRFRVQLIDYRDISGDFDFVVSVGMFEHIGVSSYPDFFKTMARALKPSGVGLLHTIGIEEEPSRIQDPWMERYIFPGSRLPRLEELAKGARTAELAVGHVENWRPHYARTLRHWRTRFFQNWPTIVRLGSRFDRRFFRTWNFYLQLCEACFIDSTVELYQLLLSPRPRWNFPRCFDFERGEWG